MNKDFVTYELAVKLKEKGFDEPFYFFYRSDDKLIHHAMVTKPIVYCDKIDDEVVCAPTIPQVLKWLREEKKIHISIDIYDDGWFFDITSFYKEDTGGYGCTIPYLASNVTPDCDSFEQAAVAGIEYVLDKLI